MRDYWCLHQRPYQFDKTTERREIDTEEQRFLSRQIVVSADAGKFCDVYGIRQNSFQLVVHTGIEFYVANAPFAVRNEHIMR